MISGFHGQGLSRFNGEWSLVTKSHVKSFKSPVLAKLNPKY